MVITQEDGIDILYETIGRFELSMKLSFTNSIAVNFIRSTYDFLLANCTFSSHALKVRTVTYTYKRL